MVYIDKYITQPRLTLQIQPMFHSHLIQSTFKTVITKDHLVKDVQQNK